MDDLERLARELRKIQAYNCIQYDEYLQQDQKKEAWNELLNFIQRLLLEARIEEHKAECDTPQPCKRLMDLESQLKELSK